MHYVCVENQYITNILNYEPSVPEGVSVYIISDDEYNSIAARTHFFNLDTLSIEPLPAERLMDLYSINLAAEKRGFLASTDWKILRHLREKALGVETSMTEQEYLALEQQRQETAKSI